MFSYPLAEAAMLALASLMASSVDRHPGQHIMYELSTGITRMLVVTRDY